AEQSGLPDRLVERNGLQPFHTNHILILGLISAFMESGFVGHRIQQWNGLAINTHSKLLNGNRSFLDDADSHIPSWWNVDKHSCPGNQWPKRLPVPTPPPPGKVAEFGRIIPGSSRPERHVKILPVPRLLRGLAPLSAAGLSLCFVWFNQPCSSEEFLRV